jgi:hypothetical protein
MLRSNECRRRMCKHECCEATNVQARMLQSNESLRGMLCEGLRRFLLKQNQKEKQNACTGKSILVVDF